jgi:8-oxo-dGTP pyrophosphatase MutT (NUDIX family)
MEKLRQHLTFPGLPRPTYAVVIPLILGPQEPELLLEVRAAGISQAGDPCFPGGRIEAGETPADAALRELQEELCLTIPPDRILGQLPTVQTYLGSKTDVFVCTVTPAEAAAIHPNPAEVAEVLRQPLSFFQNHPDTSYQVGHHTVWGMTAGAIRLLLRAWDLAEA